MNKTMLRKYARLTVRTGVNVQKGQEVTVFVSVDQAEFAKYVVDEAYKAGAKRVTVEWSMQELTILNYRHQSVKTLSEIESHFEEKVKNRVKTLPCMIHILSDDPDGLKRINAAKMQAVRRARLTALKKYNDEMDNKYQWTIVAVPSKAWARKVFPGIPTNKAVEKLWDAIFEAVRITPDNDPIQAWKEHSDNFAERCAVLNEKRFDYLTYKSANGTDFRCDLIPEALWQGGGGKTLQGIFNNPNMPTEEIFTSPMKGHCEGKLVSTKPLSYLGTLIDGFWIEFKDGRAVAWDAKVGKEALDKIITMDETSGMLGELALVPQTSPICMQNILYYNTLFDENASCHVALGAGFTDCIEGFENRTREEMIEMGINDSQVHVDFMVGAPDLEIIGYKNGVPFTVFKDGCWAF